MWDRLTRLKTYCAENRESVVSSLFYAMLVGGVALLSVPWALIVGGGLGLGVMVFARTLAWLAAESPE